MQVMIMMMTMTMIEVMKDEWLIKKESSCKCRKAPAEQSAAAAETRPDSGGRNTGFLKFLIGTSSNRDFLTMSTIFIRINDILYKMAVAAHCDDVVVKTIRCEDCFWNQLIHFFPDLCRHIRRSSLAGYFRLLVVKNFPLAVEERQNRQFSCLWDW